MKFQGTSNIEDNDYVTFEAAANLGSVQHSQVVQ